MSAVLRPNPSPAFANAGLVGYVFDRIAAPDMEVHLLDVRLGHDKVIISKAVRRLYYVISGRGTFIIGDEKMPVRPGCLVEVSPGVEYCYSGRMKLLLVSHPRWSPGNEVMIRDNPDVAGVSFVRRALARARRGAVDRARRVWRSLSRR